MTPSHTIGDATLYTGDALTVLRELPDESVQCVVTSPPYWGLRDYNEPGQIGHEPSALEYVAAIVEVMREVRRVLASDGTLWLNLGDTYASRGGLTPQTGKMFKGRARQRKAICISARRVTVETKAKDLLGIPWTVALALRDDGWYLRQDIIWSKPNPMPESVKDRCTRSHEYLFLLSKSPRYYVDQRAMLEPSRHPRGPCNKHGYVVNGQRSGTNANIGGSVHKIGARATRNRRSVWHVAPNQSQVAHFATFPSKLVEPCVLAGCPQGGVVLDPFSGIATSGTVALAHDRRYIGIELSAEYQSLAAQRLQQALVPRSSKPKATRSPRVAQRSLFADGVRQ